MYKKAFSIDKNLLLEALKGGAIGGGLGGLGLGGLTYLTDDSQDPAERNARLRNSALMGMGLGGGLGAAVGGVRALPQEVVNPFSKSPIYNFFRGITSKSDALNAGALTGASQLNSIKDNKADSKYISEVLKGDKLNVDGRLGQLEPLIKKDTIPDPEGLKKGLGGFYKGTKGKNPAGLDDLVDSYINPVDMMTEKSQANLGRAKGFVKDLMKGTGENSYLSDVGLDEAIKRLHVPEAEMAAGRAANPDFDRVLGQQRASVLDQLNNKYSGGILDRLYDNTIGRLTGGRVGTYNDQIARTAGRKPFGLAGRSLGTFGLGYAGSKAMNAVAPKILDPIMSDIDQDGNNVYVDQVLKRYNQHRGH